MTGEAELTAVAVSEEVRGMGAEDFPCFPLPVRTIPLSKGYCALVDADDYDWLSQFRWAVSLHYSHASALTCGGRKGNRHAMHRLLAGARKGQIVDHANRNPLDNRRSNLRFATHAQNLINRVLPSTSPYRGVKKRKERPGFDAAIRANGKKTHLGYFRSAEEAARAYDDAARALHGEFAVLNFPDEASR